MDMTNHSLFLNLLIINLFYLDIIPNPTRDEMMDMTVRALSKVEEDVDIKRAFKNNFVTNALDGSEDYLVSEKIMELVGSEMRKFRENLLKEKPPKTLTEMLRTITPPKGIRRKQGYELFDCEGEEISLPKEDADDDGKKFIFIRL